MARGPIRSYEDLEAWQLAMACVELVYRASSGFPPDERFGLTAQVRRAAVSVPSNIAEGYGRNARPDYLRFLRIARGSLYEVETQLLVAVRLGFLGEGEHREIQAKLAEAGRVLAGLIRSLEK
ncbi:MAG: four helix bundle protein [Planctomycetota bacterium]